MKTRLQGISRSNLFSPISGSVAKITLKSCDFKFYQGPEQILAFLDTLPRNIATDTVNQ